MSDFNTTIMDDLKTAMKAKDTVALSVLRALKTAVKNASIEKGGADAVLDDAEAISVIRKQVKQRQDSITSFEGAGRQELADKEKAEITILEKYLPAALKPEEISALVQEVIKSTGASSRADMGKVMGALQQKTGGSVDNKALSQEVIKLLS